MIPAVFLIGQQFFVYACKWFNIFFLCLYKFIVWCILWQLFTFLWCKINRIFNNIIFNCLAACRQSFSFLWNCSVDCFRIIFDNSHIIWIKFKFRRIIYIGIQRRCYPSADNFPRICKSKRNLTFAICLCHNNREHVDLSNLVLIPIQPAGIQKTLHISTHSKPFNCCCQYDCICFRDCLWQCRNCIFHLVEIVSCNIYIEFF